MHNELVVAVIGLRMGKAHLRGVVSYGARVGGICDTNPQTLNDVGDEFGIPAEKRFTDYRELVADPTINTVRHPGSAAPADVPGIPGSRQACYVREAPGADL